MCVCDCKRESDGRESEQIFLSLRLNAVVVILGKGCRGIFIITLDGNKRFIASSVMACLVHSALL